MLVFCAFTSHSPLSVSQIGQAAEKAKLAHTLASFGELSQALSRMRPDTIIIISPHAPLDPYSFVINSAATLKGSFKEFGLDETLEFSNDTELAEKISYAAYVNDIKNVLHPHFLDHGALVPLWHLVKDFSPRVVHLSFSFLDLPKHYEYGEVIARVVGESGKRVAIIASGDLSHRLSPSAPAGFSPQAHVFDQRILGALAAKDMAQIEALHRAYINVAAECGLRSFVMAMGMLHGKRYDFKLLSYEAPFGVGYLMARLF
ncbi:MAG TPA: AmmeMemoRadiSam system protein B [Candidatus Moranbacteria bacterium]|nr:AmmeMemoRadiSam system protein B [Candidatus Moranbacteria bacterium]